MRKHITLLLLLSACMAFNFCKKEIETSKVILGTWAQTSPGADAATTQKLIYTFKAGGALEVKRLVLQTSSGAVLGYRFNSTASYTIKSDSLLISNVTAFKNDDSKSSYSRLEDLIPASGVFYSPTALQFNTEKTQLVLVPKCGPLELCATIQLVRQ